jgi:Ca2+-transporting ATPase
VNDAPALKNADVGIAMGITGSDVSKEASAVILQDDHFASIVESVRQGRGIYRNIQKSIQFLLSANLMEVLVISLVFLLGYPSPILALHLLWMNLLTDALPALALGVEPIDSTIMQLKPKPKNQSLYQAFIKKALAIGLMGSVFALALYIMRYGEVSTAYLQSFILSFMVVFELCLVFAMKSEHEALQNHWRNNPLLILAVGLSFVAQLLAVYHPFFQKFLQTEALLLQDWLWIFGFSILGLILMELRKNFMKKSDHV